MKAKKYPTILLAITIVSFLAGFRFLNDDENSFIGQLNNLLSNYFKNKPFEKVYLHIDKPFYKPGEDIWFKAYLTNGLPNTPTKSDVVYVELINPRGAVEKILTLQAIQGICFGSFSLGESAIGGIYKIKAYTNWMRNFGNDYSFEKEIQVQKIIYPRLLTKFDFERKSYGPGDSVKGDLTIESLEKLPLSYRNVTVDVSLEGKKYKTFQITTDLNGKAKISFALPNTLETNDGLVNMKVAHEGTMEAISRSIPITLNNIALQFFPEGGYMVNSLPCRIAFKALNEFGKPADIEGYITDDKLKTIADFKSFHHGMGTFDMVPLPGRRYYAVITKPLISKPIELPEAKAKGYLLKVNKEQGSNYKLTFYSPLAEKVHLVVQSGNSICFSKSVNADIGINEVNFSSSKFPIGIGMVTLFDQNETPRCERLVFFNYHKQMNVKLEFNKDKYSPREKISLKIKTYDGDSIPIAANLSLSVVNDQLYTFADDKQHNIASWLLAGSDVKGKIEEPNFYFKPDEPKAEKALDYLLMTQGWRRYQWDEVQRMNYNILFNAEKIGCVTGRVVDKNTQEPIQAEVTMMELQNRKRILTVKTGLSGKFKFLDADASSPLQILAKADNVKPNDLAIEITQLNEVASSEKGGALEKNKLLPEIIAVQAFDQSKNKIIVIPNDKLNQNGGNDIVLNEDVKKLEEVVVIGYGTQKKSDLTGSVVCIRKDELSRTPAANLNDALQGRVAGIDIINSSGQPGAGKQIRIRGSASLSGNSNPLYVIDGVAFDPNIAGYSSPLQNILPQNIESVSVLKDESATAIYGSRGTNGVILIETKSSYWGNFKFFKKTVKPKYAGLLVTPRQISITKEFYHPIYEKEEIPEVREDFRSTVYWNPNINTNQAGEATVEFYNSDEITTFRAIAEGISQNGLVGREEKKYFTQLPFSMAVKFPAYLTFGDTVQMPLIVKNNTTSIIKGKLQIELPACLEPIASLPNMLEVEANSTKNITITFFVKSIAGKDTLKIKYRGDKFRDAFIQEVEVQPKGFPTFVSVSGKEKEKHFAFHINQPVRGSIKASFTAFPDLLTDLMSGVESILREPYGCFEQTSSSTYPNVMVLQYLNETGVSDPSVVKKASDLIQRGYQKLVSFETTEKGYEWFGSAPAHEGLTAYGLMEFTDMKEVYKDVDKKMLERTLNWILAKRNGKGGFNRNSRALDQFGQASDAVNNAYIIYALSEAGIDNIDKEYKEALNEALASLDPYRMSLMANAAFNLKKKDDGIVLMLKLENITKNKSWDKIKIDHSITRSYGQSLTIETASLYALALMKAPEANWLVIHSTINYLVSSRSNGGFGSTQATILALKAMKDYARLAKQTSESGKIEISINGKQASTYTYEKGAKGKITLENLETYLKEGENTVDIRFLETNTPLPYSFDGNWNSQTPASSGNCKIDLMTSLSTNITKVGETVRMTVKIANKTVEGLPMTIALVGIPSGLSLQPWQLKEIKEKNQVDFYEVLKNYLVIYYRQMKPSEEHVINLDLKAEIPGTYQAPASPAYLYYTNEYKNWQPGESVVIKQ